MRGSTMVVSVLLAGWTAWPAVAQGPAPEAPAPRREASARVQERMREVFRARLRADLRLTDEQVARVVPPLEALEGRRREIRRERLGLIRDLRRALRDGSDDAAIDSRLERLDRLGMEQEQAARRALEEVDRALSARQKVELRFFVARFRREVGERLEAARELDRGRRRR